MMSNDFPSARYDLWKQTPPNEADDELVALTENANEVLDGIGALLDECRVATNKSDLNTLVDRLGEVKDATTWLISDLSRYLA